MYEIKALDNQVSSNTTTIPKPPFSLGLISPRGSGKTTLLINLLINPDFYKEKFNKVIIFSPTFYNDEKWNMIFKTPILTENKKLNKFINKKDKIKIDDEEDEEKYNPYIEKDDIYTDYTDAYLGEILKYQNSVIKSLGKSYADSILMIFDDLVGSNLFKSKLFLKLNANLRHLKISLVMVSQAYKIIPKTIRTNLSGLVLFDIPNEKEIEVIYEENPVGLSKKNWLKVYRQITTPDYSFLFINYQNSKKKQIVECFKNIILLK